MSFEPALATQKALIATWRLSRTGSMVPRIEPAYSTEERSSVIPAKMHTFDSGRTLEKTLEMESSWPTSKTWADFITLRDAMFNEVTLRFTLLSPIKV